MLKQILVGAAFVVAAPALADVTPSSPPKETVKGDPDRVVCEREEVIGSRLGARRVCLTVSQWQEKRREHREATERVQQGVNMAPSH